MVGLEAITGAATKEAAGRELAAKQRRGRTNPGASQPRGSPLAAVGLFRSSIPSRRYAALRPQPPTRFSCSPPEIPRPVPGSSPALPFPPNSPLTTRFSSSALPPLKRPRPESSLVGGRRCPRLYWCWTATDRLGSIRF
jgi:hypothetical protein